MGARGTGRSRRRSTDDMGTTQKVIVDLACTPHKSQWERNGPPLFRASLEWLRDGSVNGAKHGVVKLGYSLSRARILSLSAFPSTRFPANLALAAFITKPILALSVTPVSLMADSMATAISSSDGAAGK